MSSPEMSGGMAAFGRNGPPRIGVTGESGESGAVTGAARSHRNRPISPFAALLAKGTDGGSVSAAKTFGDLRDRLLNGSSLAPRDLLALQIRAGEIGVSVELVSKIADGILGVARRLQAPQ